MHKEAKDNTNRALNIIHTIESKAIPAILLSHDAEKPFDRVDWMFMHMVLEHIGVGPHMRFWIKVLHYSPSVIVRVKYVSSPLLFKLTLEPLLSNIRIHRDIKGIEEGDMEQRVAG